MREYVIYNENFKYYILAKDRDDAIYTLKQETGMSIEHIKRNYHIKRVYD